MSAKVPSDDSEPSALLRRIAHLEAREVLTRATDELVERSLEARTGLGEMLEDALRLLQEASGAQLLFAEALDEKRSLPSHLDIGAALRKSAGPYLEHDFSVGSRCYGRAGLFFSESVDASAVHDARGLLEGWCEVLDDHVAMLALARERHAVIRSMSWELGESVLEAGIDRAVAVLARAICFDDLVLVFRPTDGLAPLQHLWFRRRPDGSLEARHEHPRLLEQSRAVFDGHLEGLFGDIGAFAYQEEIILGAREPKKIGRVILGRWGGPRGGPGKLDCELGQVFVDCLRQRLVDFSREHAQLSQCFPPAVVDRLLRQPGYRTRYLSPREAPVAVMFADIAGFTRVSEGILRTPSLIGRLIDVWSAQVVAAIWDTGGVFDKLVGDCAIALWGPPFLEMDAQTACECALQAAMTIRELTRALPSQSEFSELGEGLGVAVGLNYAPLCVGLFGPNDNYTGFSSGMNNAARLQGLAGGHEIFCMESFVEALGRPDRFGPQEAAKVKNVQEALVYRRLS